MQTHNLTENKSITPAKMMISLSKDSKSLLGLLPNEQISFTQIIPKVSIPKETKEIIKANLMMNFNAYNLPEDKRKMYSFKIEQLFDFLLKENIPANYILKGLDRFFKGAKYPTWTIAEVYSYIEPDLSKLFPYSRVLELLNDDKSIYSKIDSYWVNYSQLDEIPIVLYMYIDNVDLTVYGLPKVWSGRLNKTITELPKKVNHTQKKSNLIKKNAEPFDIGEAGREFLREYNLYKSQGDKNPN